MTIEIEGTEVLVTKMIVSIKVDLGTKDIMGNEDTEETKELVDNKDTIRTEDSVRTIKCFFFFFWNLTTEVYENV